MTSGGETRLFGRCTRGIEGMLAAEVQERLGGEVLEVGHRQVQFQTGSDLRRVLDLRCADDVFLSCGVVEGVSRERASLNRLARGLSSLDLQPGLQTVAGIREAEPTRFDVVCSFLGQRNYNRFEAEGAAAGEIGKQVQLPRVSLERRRDADISWRIHVDGEQALVGLRIAAQPLHRRSWRIHGQPGALHPPVAAAMALLARPESGATVLDPLCGSGTLCVEAGLFEDTAHVVGGDASAEALRIAGEHARLAGTSFRGVVADGARLPLADDGVDIVLCNPAWGRSVTLRGQLGRDPDLLWQEIARVLRSDGKALVLMETQVEAAVLDSAGLQSINRLAIRVSGRWATLNTVVAG